MSSHLIEYMEREGLIHEMSEEINKYFDRFRLVSASHCFYSAMKGDEARAGLERVETRLEETRGKFLDTLRKYDRLMATYGDNGSEENNFHFECCDHWIDFLVGVNNDLVGRIETSYKFLKMWDEVDND